ncbi:nucleotidyl transferase AbiEii/AbiGii toxin family protein [Parabacteroides sp. Marseille-P3160]|uniref:nucleotidyl transferase AbiEii/AbiGii toxin family protein n=1 Tax=Parabacteroides sp. Marseille-P3160 TaxID=1917887 RepID=UPI001F46D8A5|nr:nucleotidyl transferase AbiEii/AbiGii toxin family protein [Parabacteroides sp. Marseille-P3160]
MNDEAFSRFVLVGGTSLALLLGHRISVDLYLFTDEPFDEPISLTNGKRFNWKKVRQTT